MQLVICCNNHHKKHGLRFAGISFLQVDLTVMKKSIWPLLQKEVSPGPNQSLVIYHALLVAEERFPSVVTAKYLKQTLGGPKVLTAATMPGLLTALQVNRIF